MSPSYAHVIPVQRTPFGVQGFDYLIPEGLHIQVGSLVVIPFRRTTLVGLVHHISYKSAFAGKAKSISRLYSSIVFPSSIIRLLEWTSARTFSTLPTVLASWVRHLPKRPETFISATMAPVHTNIKTKIHLEAEWDHQASALLLKRARDMQRRGKRVLIVSPWITRVRAYQTKLETASVLHSDLNDGDAFRAWTTFITQSNSCLITTRLGAWLAPWADIVLLDEPENDDHKQDELAPRYDARLMLVWCAKFAGIAVESYGLTPPIHVDTAAPVIDVDLHIHPRRPGGFSRISCIQSDSLELLRAHEGARIIYHPIRGMAARLVCRDCGWRMICSVCGFALSAEREWARCRQCQKNHPLPTTCLLCKGSDLGKSMPGIEKLQAQWNAFEKDVLVDWRTLSNEDVDKPIPEHAMVLLTDGTLLGGAVDDVRRRERTCVAFRRLSARVSHARGTLIVQCPETIDPITHHPSTPAHWNEWLTPDGYATFRLKERQDRHLFHYPPAHRVVKCLVDGDEKTAHTWGEEVSQLLQKQIVLRGPFPVAYRPSTRSQRFVWHLLLPPDTSEEYLIRTLTPFARSAIIDLDPIAFFK